MTPEGDTEVKRRVASAARAVNAQIGRRPAPEMTFLFTPEAARRATPDAYLEQTLGIADAER